LQQTAILKWSLAAKFKAIPFDTGIKTKKSNQQQLPARYFSSNILKKPEGNFRVLILKLVILILFYDSNQ
jgi:hypothetical protein